MVLALISAFAALSAPPDIAPANDKWWKDAKFGMFIHWGLYAVPADATYKDGNRGIAEWYFSNKQMQVHDYEKFAPQFNPTKFDAKAWVSVAKNAGMKYIVVTTKHHDGFCMWDTKLSDYSITKATPFRRDPMRELAAECKRQGIQLCFYHSIMDWHHPDYLPRRKWEGRPTDSADLNRYIDTMQGQLKELLTNYGKIGVVWFDGGWEHNATELRAKQTDRMIRQLQPGILINDRNALPADFTTPEQTIPAHAIPDGRKWETCMTMNDTWGYAKDDQNWKSSTDLIRKLCDIASKGGNFLLNVGPMDTGEFPRASVDRLDDVGKWMKRYGRAIYGSSQSPFPRPIFDGRVTAKGNLLYLSVFNWPKDGRLPLPGLQTPISSAKVIGGPDLIVEGNAVVGRFATPDPAATVVEVRLAAAPLVIVEPLKHSGDKPFSLTPDQAILRGGLQVEEKDGQPNVGFWTNLSGSIEWKFELGKAGRYRVDIEYACPPTSAGSSVDCAGLTGTVKGTGSWSSFETMALGEVKLEAGSQVLTLRATSMPHGAVMNVRKVLLSPAS